MFCSQRFLRAEKHCAFQTNRFHSSLHTVTPDAWHWLLRECPCIALYRDTTTNPEWSKSPPRHTIATVSRLPMQSRGQRISGPKVSSHFVVKTVNVLCEMCFLLLQSLDSQFVLTVFGLRTRDARMSTVLQHSHPAVAALSPRRCTASLPGSAALSPGAAKLRCVSIAGFATCVSGSETRGVESSKSNLTQKSPGKSVSFSFT